jgi:hypothetical protein
MVNYYLLIYGRDAIDTPALAPYPPQNYLILVERSTDTLWLRYAPDWPGMDKITVTHISAPLSPGVSSKPKVTRFVRAVWTEDYLSHIGADYLAAYGRLPGVGNRVWLKHWLMDPVTGAMSQVTTGIFTVIAH